jgi:hypothetical protein
LRGIDALTGDSNFDIAESIWLKLIVELAGERPTIALLCKSSVARSVLSFAHQASLAVDNASMWLIDAKTWFGASVDACLLRLRVGAEHPCYDLAVFDDLQAQKPVRTAGMVRGTLVPDLASYETRAFADGTCPLTWRQGVKHDASALMELRSSSSGLRNGLGEAVEIEEEYLYPLLKGADLSAPGAVLPRYTVIVTQRQLGEETSKLGVVAPKLWKYLNAHRETFDGRKSSIYRSQPSFAMFGIGSYSFSKYKVAVSGLHKTIRFRAIGTLEGKPVLLDDTCYFVPCALMRQAALLVALLNDCRCTEFLDSIVFWDAKRPIKKSVLQRINLGALLRVIPRAELIANADREMQRLSGPGGFEWPQSLEDVLFSPAYGGSNAALQRTFDSQW